MRLAVNSLQGISNYGQFTRKENDSVDLVQGAGSPRLSQKDTIKWVFV